MKTRILVVRRRCPFCRAIKKVINRINLRLPIENRIVIKDAWEWEEFGLDDIPILKKLEKDGLSEGFPFLFIDGIIIEPAPTEEQSKILLENYLSGEFII